MGVESYDFDVGYPIQADTLILPETVVEDFSTPVNTILKPIFDLVWNTCGYPSSRNFDAKGNWNRPWLIVERRRVELIQPSRPRSHSVPTPVPRIVAPHDSRDGFGTLFPAPSVNPVNERWGRVWRRENRLHITTW